MTYFTNCSKERGRLSFLRQSGGTAGRRIFWTEETPEESTTGHATVTAKATGTVPPANNSCGQATGGSRAQFGFYGRHFVFLKSLERSVRSHSVFRGPNRANFYSKQNKLEPFLR